MTFYESMVINLRNLTSKSVYLELQWTSAHCQGSLKCLVNVHLTEQQKWLHTVCNKSTEYKVHFSILYTCNSSSSMLVYIFFVECPQVGRINGLHVTKVSHASLVNCINAGNADSGFQGKKSTSTLFCACQLSHFLPSVVLRFYSAFHP